MNKQKKSVQLLLAKGERGDIAMVRLRVRRVLIHAWKHITSNLNEERSVGPGLCN